MKLVELEMFNWALELAESGQKTHAHHILLTLGRTNPDNSRLLLCSIFTTDNLDEARQNLNKAIQLDPDNPSITIAKIWLAHRQQQIESPSPKPTSNFIGKSPFPFPVAPPILDVKPDLYSEKSSAVAVLEANEIAAEPTQISYTSDLDSNPPISFSDLSHSLRLPLPQSVRPIAASTPKTWLHLSLDRWLQIWIGLLIIVTSLVAIHFISITGLFSDLTEAEKSYWGQVREINQQVNAANGQLRQLETQGLNRLSLKQSLRHQLGEFVEANKRFRNIMSPSPRFQRADGLLGLAYSSFSDGANLIIQGLDNDNQELIERGNQELMVGNDFLRQARDELKTLKLA